MQVLASRVLIRPADLDDSVEFYEDRVGLARFREWGTRPHRGIVYFLGGGYLEISETPPGDDPGPRPAGLRLWLQVEDADVACRTLESRGVAIDQWATRQPWGLIEAIVHDPDGLEILVVETPLDHPLRRRE